MIDNTKYFLDNATFFAKNQGNDIDDAIFVKKFQNHLSNLPPSLALKVQWLNTFIEVSELEYQNHLKKQNGVPCINTCKYQLAYHRGVPHAKAELNKIDKMYLIAEKSVTVLKGLPKWIASKLLSIAMFK